MIEISTAVKHHFRNTFSYCAFSNKFTDNNGYKNFQQQIALAMQGKQTAKEALDKSVEFANEKLAQ